MGMAVGRDGPGGVWWTSSSSSTAPKESGKRAQRFGKHGTSSAPGREGRFGHPLAGAFPVRAHAYLVREHVGSVFSICLAGSPTQPALRSLSQREIYWSTGWVRALSQNSWEAGKVSRICTPSMGTLEGGQYPVHPFRPAPASVPRAWEDRPSPDSRSGRTAAFRRRMARRGLERLAVPAGGCEWAIEEACGCILRGPL